MPRPSITWLITDTHFYHDQMIQLCDRPEGFERLIMSNLKSLVAQQDLLIHLGDVIFYKYSELHDMLDTIPCRKILTMGNHDRKKKGWYMRNGFDFAVDSFAMGNTVFSHKPLKVLPSGVEYNIHGHFHNTGHRKGEEWYCDKVHRCLAIENTGYKPVKLVEFLPEAKV